MFEKKHEITLEAFQISDDDELRQDLAETLGIKNIPLGLDYIEVADFINENAEPYRLLTFLTENT